MILVIKSEGKKVKLLMELHLTPTGCHLPYGIAPRLNPSQTPADWLVLDLPTPEGWKAELT